MQSETTNIDIHLASEHPLPDNVQEMINDMGNYFVAAVAAGPMDTEEEAIEVFNKVFDYAEQKGYDIVLVQQIISQTLAELVNSEEDQEDHGN